MGSSVILPQPGQPKTGPDPAFKSATQPNIVAFSFDRVGPPSPLYITRDDIIRVRAFSTTPGGSIQLAVRMLLPDLGAGGALGQPDQPPTPSGEPTVAQVRSAFPILVPIQQIYVIPATRALTDNFLSLGEGFLLDVTVQELAGSADRGQLFSSVALYRGTVTQGFVVQMLCADYVGNGLPIGWPAGRIIHPLEGPGWIHSLQVTNPAAGADWTLTAVAGQRLRITSFQAQLTTSAAAATRNVSVIVDDGANTYWTASVAAGIPASTTDQIVGTGTNSPAGVITTVQSVVLPPGLILPPGHRIRSSTGNIQAGDQWSAIWFGVEEWLNTV